MGMEIIATRKMVMVLPAFILLMFSGCRNADTAPNKEKAIQKLEETDRERNFERLLFLADSLGNVGDLNEGEAYYWQGFAYYRLKQRRTAEFYWKESIMAMGNATDERGLATYARSASYLAGLYIRYINFTSALTIVMPALKKLEAEHYTDNGDYTNLLIFAGCCKAYFNPNDSLANQLFEQAYQQHTVHIKENPSRSAYRDAVVGYINISYGWLSVKKYQQALTWTERLGQLIRNYKALYPDDKAYIDKQWARYNIFAAIGYKGIGAIEKADEAYESYQQTHFSKTLEGKLDASDYLMMAEHWKEAASNLSELDKIFVSEQVGQSLEDIQTKLLNKYRANYMAGMRDSANAVANQICQRLDSAIIKSQWIDAEELEVIRQKEEQILEQEKRLARGRILALLATIITLSTFFTVYTIIRHRAQRRLADANAQLEQKNKQLTIANARAEESAKMKTNFIQQISHEIRTPLNILSGFTQVITTPGMELDSDTKQDINRQITENTDRITGLVNKMLELSDASSMSVIECIDKVPAIQIASQAVEAAGITQASHLIFNFQVSPEAESTMLTTNLTAATRALTLLLDNAQKFTHAPEAHRSQEEPEQKPRAELRVAAESGKALFIVEDTGIGVPVSEAEHIFEEFVQLDEYYDGTGIGLTIARALARRMGGDIELDTTYTAGARFVMHLPTDIS
jgi:signal transduction histidine kinase